MTKRIFSESEPESATHQPKREFGGEAQIEQDEPITKQTANLAPLSQILTDEKPNRVWLRLFLGAILFFGLALLAQSLQWLFEAWQQRRWIDGAFAVALLAMSLAGFGALIGEWRKLRWLRHHHFQQQQSQQFFRQQEAASGEKARLFCEQHLTKWRNQPQIAELGQHWQRQLHDAYSGQEVCTLFSRTVLAPLDQQAKRLISQSALENALIVAISPLALADVLFVAWRNLALVNKISRLYGMELGYFSRLRLFKMVLTNMAFAGASEVASDLGAEFFSQNLTAKLSMRAAQGVGVGLLTARLGIKAMEFCRPIGFQAGERPSLSVVRQTLLGELTSRLFSRSKTQANVQANAQTNTNDE